MRTTITIDEDVLLAVKELALREGRTMGDVLSDLARRGLTHREATNEEDDFFGFRPLPHRGPAVSNKLIDRLREEEHV